ncbi:signal peptidase II [Halovulum dunhuangense]|uniref:Lipoprotein signal peptidase n=1 Tax=Halovulum dunhuangense TaxID=1505036 RepID=A0A849KRT8_9RHOB|nr:signal peptidase II [Halovulum dunhuangense]NNU79579.1 signal peptidase II [Halovulum dunhuangense]
MRGLSLLGVTALLVLALDRLTKLWVVEWMDLKTRFAIEVLPPFLQFRMAWNRGINFGLMGSDAEAMRWGLAALAVAVSVGLAWWARRAGGLYVPLAGGLIVGGALGNAWDRVTYGAVADFLNMSCCGIDNPFSFNVADAAIFVGAVALIFMPDPGKRADRT